MRGYEEGDTTTPLSLSHAGKPGSAFLRVPPAPCWRHCTQLHPVVPPRTSVPGTDPKQGWRCGLRSRCWFPARSGRNSVATRRATGPSAVRRPPLQRRLQPARRTSPEALCRFFGSRDTRRRSRRTRCPEEWPQADAEFRVLPEHLGVVGNMHGSSLRSLVPNSGAAAILSGLQPGSLIGRSSQLALLVVDFLLFHPLHLRLQGR